MGGGADDTADSDWARRKPTKEGEVTVVLKNGATFTGMLAKEDDTMIVLKMGTAEMEWPKRDLQEVIRFEGTSSDSSSVAGKLKWPLGKQ